MKPREVDCGGQPGRAAADDQTVEIGFAHGPLAIVRQARNA
jgi:hypothetical protein